MGNNAILAWVMYGAVFLAVLLLVEGLYCLIFEYGLGSAPKLHQRLGMQSALAAGEAGPLRRRKDRRSLVSALLARIPGLSTLEAQLSGAGYRVTALRALLCLLGAAAAAFCLAMLFGVSPAGSAAGAVAVAVAAPAIILRRLAKKRTEKFLEQLPDAIDMMVRSLRAGHPIAATIELVAREMSDPVRGEFVLLRDEIAYGLDLRDALDNLAQRIALRELHYMTVAIRLQISTGGNLAETLEVLSHVIRDRGKLKSKIKALSAEGRLSAKVLSALPFLVAGAIRVISPHYYAGATDDPVIGGGLCAAVAMIGLGIVIMRRMVNFRV